jgi:hypothetical protein
MKKSLFLFLLISTISNAQIAREKKVILEKEFSVVNFLPPPFYREGNVWSEFGDLFFEKNGKQYWLATFTAIRSTNFDFYRMFEIKSDSGIVREVTKSMLGDYYKVGGLNPPYYYEDIDNDGIKDIMIFDHGKEVIGDEKNWKDYNVFFKGTALGFEKKEIPFITTIKQYYHAHAVGDFDNDGDLDIAMSSNELLIYKNDGKGNFSESLIPSYKENQWFGKQILINGTWYYVGTPGLKFTNIDLDDELELLGSMDELVIAFDFNGKTWEGKLFSQPKPFLWKVGVHIGCEQILDFPQKSGIKKDLVYRISTFDKTKSRPQGEWFSKFFRSSPLKIDSIIAFKSALIDTGIINYLDPKKADINFDGYDDIVFKENGYGNWYQHPINQRIWLNDGLNNFNPMSHSFANDANKSVYLFVKSDKTKKYSLFMTYNHLTENTLPNGNKQLLYTRLDSLIYPKIEKHKITICKGATSKYNPAFVPVGLSVVKSGKLGSLSLSNNLLTYTPTSSGSDTIRYRLKNDFFESTDYEIIYNVVNNPAAPAITREGNTTLISSSQSGNQWFLDGSIIKGEVGQKINATVNGLYSVKYTDANGCLSENSASLYGLITATGLTDKKVIISPNPFEQSIKIEFPEDFGPFVHAKIHDVKGVVVWEKESVRDSEIVDLSSLSVGNYVLNLTSQTNGQVSIVKISKQGR